jgi:hypothetical protein
MQWVKYLPGEFRPHPRERNVEFVDEPGSDRGGDAETRRRGDEQQGAGDR